ncbi:MAG: putative Ig domain-containing protein, partial [Acholeplasmataceae bacterium]
MGQLIGDGAFHTRALSRLGKPWSIELDGPVGLVPRQVNGSLMEINDYVACVYATEPVVAATWNKDLVNEYGQMTGEEGIWGNTNYAYSGIYGPGLNIHRSQFSGRNGEYYSEDGVLSGKMAAEYSGGAYSKGLYTMMKHYALNDQETNRGGVLTWADEQTMREIYFLPYEKAIKDGHSRGAMAAYNSIGTKWSGASYALMTELTRDEWGFDGMIVTDWGGYSTSNEWMIRTGVDLLLAGSGAGTLINSGEGLTATQAWALRRASKAIMFTVANSNAMIPRLSYDGVNPNIANFQRGVPYLLDVSGAMPNYELSQPLVVTYSASGLPSQLTLDPTTGIITGTLPAANPAQWWSVPASTYTFTVTATVPSGNTINTTVSKVFTINQAAMSEIKMLDSGRVGEEYFSDAILVDPSIPFDAQDITYQLEPGLKYGTYVIKAASAPLPDGLVLNPNGTITGVPTTEISNVQIIVKVTAPGFVDAYITRTISILPANPMIEFDDALLSSGQVGSTYSASLSASGVSGITFTSDNLPAGLSLNSTGTISGTPTAAGLYVFTVTASAEGVKSTTASVVLNIAEVVPPVITFNDVLLSSGQVGSEFSAALSASGATGITFTSDDLPAGLTLSSTGTISGTPTTEGTYMFTVTASATGAQSAEASITLSIAEVVLPVITFSDVLLSSGQVGSEFSATLSASGATGITFTSDDLPAGLVLSSTGTISGTPTAEGTYMFTVTASATGAQSAEASITLSVAAEVAETGCGSALGVSSVAMAILSVTLAGVFIFIRKRH